MGSERQYVIRYMSQGYIMSNRNAAVCTWLQAGTPVILPSSRWTMGWFERMERWVLGGALYPDDDHGLT